MWQSLCSGKEILRHQTTCGEIQKKKKDPTGTKQASYPNNPVSFGTFHALKPFYIWFATAKDIEMCVCKKHLHAS